MFRFFIIENGFGKASKHIEFLNSFTLIFNLQFVSVVFIFTYFDRFQANKIENKLI